MTKDEKQNLAKKIINITDKEMNDEDFIHRLLSETEIYNINDDNPTFGQRAADRLARFAGSWIFVFLAIIILGVWVVFNIYFLKPPFDPYPFILLNLILSCVSALQAPLIMMSQNRQEEKDRRRNESEYRINLKSEIIVEDIHYKLDTIIKQQKKIIEFLDVKDKK